MTVFRAIYKRELKSYFATPVGYVFIVVFLIGSAYLTFAPGYGGFFENGHANVAPLFDYLPYLFIFLVPAIAMRLWAEERRSGTAELLFTMPVKVSHAVLAKYFAAWTVLGFALLLTGTFVCINYTLAAPGTPDVGPIVSSYIGGLLLGGTYLAIGSFCSALSKNQVISFILAVIACIVFLTLGSPPMLNLLSQFIPSKFVLDLLEAHSLQAHFESMQRGVLELQDLAYFGSLIVAWLASCGVILDYQKAN